LYDDPNFRPNGFLFVHVQQPVSNTYCKALTVRLVLDEHGKKLWPAVQPMFVGAIPGE